MRKSDVRALGVLGVLLSLAFIIAPLMPHTWGYDYPPCESESGDSVAPCVWVAPERGNGKGRSFIAYPDGRVEYLD